MNQIRHAVEPYTINITNFNSPIAQVTMEMIIEFDRNSADLKPRYHKELAKVANFLRENNALTATIRGQAINSQPVARPMQHICQKPAQQLINYLVDIENIQRSRLTVDGFIQENEGIDNPIYNHTENFRMSIVLNYK